jgi:hypothetical protein
MPLVDEKVVVASDVQNRRETRRTRIQRRAPFFRDADPQHHLVAFYGRRPPANLNASALWSKKGNSRYML